MFDSKKKKSQFGPPVLCRTFSFDPPLLSLLPPTTPPTQTHRHTGSSRSAGYHTSEPFLSSAQRCLLLNIYPHCIVYMSTLLQQADTEGGEREIGEREKVTGREREREREE